MGPLNDPMASQLGQMPSPGAMPAGPAPGPGGMQLPDFNPQTGANLNAMAPPPGAMNLPQMPISTTPAFSPGTNPLGQTPVAGPGFGQQLRNNFTNLGQGLANSPLGQLAQGKPGGLVQGLAQYGKNLQKAAGIEPGQQASKKQQSQNIGQTGSAIANQFVGQNQQMQDLIKKLTAQLSQAGVSNSTLQNAAQSASGGQ